MRRILINQKKNKSDESWIKSFVKEEGKQMKVQDDLNKLPLSKQNPLPEKLVNLKD